MLKIILSRTGKKKQAFFKVLVTQKHKDPWGTYLENLGNYNPRSKALELKADRVKYWISQGAEPSATIWNMLVDKGIVEGKKKKVTKISKSRAAKIAVKSASASADAKALADKKATADAEKKASEPAPAAEAPKAEEPKV